MSKDHFTHFCKKRDNGGESSLDINHTLQSTDMCKDVN